MIDSGHVIDNNAASRGVTSPCLLAPSRVARFIGVTETLWLPIVSLGIPYDVSALDVVESDSDRAMVRFESGQKYVSQSLIVSSAPHGRRSVRFPTSLHLHTPSRTEEKDLGS